jgi:hypothetical protein
MSHGLNSSSSDIKSCDKARRGDDLMDRELQFSRIKRCIPMVRDVLYSGNKGNNIHRAAIDYASVSHAGINDAAIGYASVKRAGIGYAAMGSAGSSVCTTAEVNKSHIHAASVCAYIGWADIKSRIVITACGRCGFHTA